MVQLTFITKALSWLADPKNRQLIGIGIIIALIIMLMMTCGRVSTLQGKMEEAKKEQVRLQNNYDASQDSVEMFVTENGELAGKISGYDLKLGELEDEYDELLGKYEIEKNKPPVTITETVTEVRDSLIYVEAEVIGDSTISVSDSAFYGENNWRYLTGSIPYTIDTTLNRLDIGQSIFALEQSIELKTVLTREKKTGKIEIQVSTEYPGITFPVIQGAVITDDKENKKVLRQARKEWGASVQVGYGGMLDFSEINRSGVVRFAHGPYIGFGIHYSPKWAQWGK